MKKPPSKKDRDQAWKALKEREIILKSLSPKLTGKVRAIFSVISDDIVKKRVWKAPTSSEAAPSTGTCPVELNYN